jgi:hypothetical protein
LPRSASRSPSNRLRGLLACCLLAAGTAGAQTTDESDEESARLPYEQLGRRQNEAHLALVRSVRTVSSENDIRTEIVSAVVGFSRGITERLELGVLLPYALSSERTTTDAAGQTVRSEEREGFGDPTFRARYALLDDRHALRVTVGLLASPDWGGRTSSFSSQTDYYEPFIVLGRALTPTTSIGLRYGYAFHGGGAPEAHRFTLGLRRRIAPGYGALATLGYSKVGASEVTDGHNAWRAALGGFWDAAPMLQLVGWLARSATDERERRDSGPRIDEGNGHQIGFSIVKRF